MKDLNDKYPWWDWSYFIQMQIDWLENASKRHREDGITVDHEKVADELQLAANLLKEAYEEMDINSLSEEDLKRGEDKMKEAYTYIINNLRGWWD